MRKLTLSSSCAQWARELVHASVKVSCEQRFLHRLHCVLLISQDRSCSEVARWFGESPRTIERWVHAFDECGVDGLRVHYGSGRPTKLSRDQAQRVALDLRKPPLFSGHPARKWSGKLLALHLAAIYGVQLTPRQCQRMLRQANRLLERAEIATPFSSPTERNAHAPTGTGSVARRV